MACGQKYDYLRTTQRSTSEHISRFEGCVDLNNDQVQPATWERLLQIEFIVSKCNVVTVTNKKN